jgi:hypothetical protein
VMHLLECNSDFSAYEREPRCFTKFFIIRHGISSTSLSFDFSSPSLFEVFELLQVG